MPRQAVAPSFAGPPSTSVFVQFQHNGVTQVQVNGQPAVIVQGAGPQPVFGSVVISPEEQRILKDTIREASHEELMAIVELMVQSVPGAKEFMKGAATHHHNPHAPSVRNDSPQVAAAMAFGHAAAVATLDQNNLNAHPAQNHMSIPRDSAAHSFQPPPPHSNVFELAEAPLYNLYPSRTIREVWVEWSSGLEGWPPLRDMEEKWGPQLRPTNRQRAAWCRRKVLIDEIQARIRRMKGQVEGVSDAEIEEMVVEEMEGERAERSLYSMLKEMQDRKRAERGGSQ